MLGVSANKDVSAMEAAEETNDGIKSQVDLSIRDTLEALPQLVVRVGGHVVRGHVLLVHEVLEGHITVLLELDVVLEGLLN